MTLPQCPSCQQTKDVELFAKSEPMTPEKSVSRGGAVQWVSYRCTRCNTALVRLEEVAAE